jgi:hypothetical protein
VRRIAEKAASPAARRRDADIQCIAPPSRSTGPGAADHRSAAAAGSRQLRITYELDGTRSFFVSVNGGTAAEVPVTGTSWSAQAGATVTVGVAAGNNTIKFFNTGAFAPDPDRIDLS